MKKRDRKTVKERKGEKGENRNGKGNIRTPIDISAFSKRK